MLKVSVSQQNGYLTWVTFAEGRVLERETKVEKVVNNVPAMASALASGLRSIAKYLGKGSTPYTVTDRVVVEVNRKQFRQWLEERKVKGVYKDYAGEVLKAFDQLTIPVEVDLVPNAINTLADRYNKEGQETQKERVSALDWFGEED